VSKLAASSRLDTVELGFDEVWQEPLLPRPGRELLKAELLDADAQRLHSLSQAVSRQLSEQEVTFNILGVPGGESRTWQLDLIPWVLEARMWQGLEQALSQRAQLFERLLEDCYGPQRLLQAGLLPPMVVLHNPGFLRPCRSFMPRGQHRLWLYAADLARRPDGEFEVFSDRAAAPTGAGYALENRLALGRVLGELFRHYRVQKVRAFFDKMKACVEQLSGGSSRSQVRAVVLTTGMADESAFEHAYLARYLGYELAEGRDLSVRGGEVFLKTVSGLAKVDVILRRVPDTLCDPLELREDSLSGVPGLVAAARAGNVGLANPLGASLIEAPVLKAFLPALCRELLGEELKLGSVETLWCAQRGVLARLEQEPHRFVVKPAFAERRSAVHRLDELALEARRQLLLQVKERPHEFVAEAWPSFSTGPIFKEGRLGSGELTLRTFLCRDGESFSVMPGGFARVDAAPDGIFLSPHLERSCKDVWIVGGRELEPPQLPKMPDGRVQLRRGGLDLPSRLVDDIYWLGRYLERCDAATRLTRAAFERTDEEATPEARPLLVGVLRLLQAWGQIPGGFSVEQVVRGGEKARVEAILVGILADRDSEANLFGTLQRVHRLTVGVRSRLSRDAWRILNKLTTRLSGEGIATSSRDELLEILDEILMLLAAAGGVTQDNMVRGYAWLFVDLGRRLERATATLELLRELLPSGAGRAHMEGLLEITDSLLTYRARYLSALQVAPVVDLLLTDSSNPRSVLFQVEVMLQHVRQLPRPPGMLITRAEKRLTTLQAVLVAADIELATGSTGAGLRQLLEDSSTLLWQLSDDVAKAWFSHAEISRALAVPAWIDEKLGDS
jgi:uncharacterized circularly permuted ATP-grasp superfamily protein/uncharacterized alpha-E superfamily protein